MNQTTLKSLLYLWNEQGLFRGDLNPIQQYCLSWVLSQKSEDRIDLLKIQTLAQNPDVYKALFEDPLSHPNAGWQPLDPTEEADVLAEFERMQAQKDSL